MIFGYHTTFNMPRLPESMIFYFRTMELKRIRVKTENKGVSRLIEKAHILTTMIT